jgi:hypothetical protein
MDNVMYLCCGWWYCDINEESYNVTCYAISRWISISDIYHIEHFGMSYSATQIRLDASQLILTIISNRISHSM